MGTWPMVIVGIPAHNEAAAIAGVVARSLPYASSVVVVDDGSTDATTANAVRAGAGVLRHETNLGKGAAVASLFEYALIHRADVLVLLDGDGQHDPDQIPLVAGPCLDGRADMVVGSRYISDAKWEIPRVRRCGQALFNTMTSLASGIGCSDSQSGFRAFSRRALCEMRLSESSFSVECEMQFEAAARRLRLAEVPISCSYAMPPKRNILVHGYDVFSRLGTMMVHRRLLGAAPELRQVALAQQTGRTEEAYETAVLASGD